MLRTFAVKDGKLVVDSPDGNILFYTAPTDEEKRELITKYSIDEHTLASALDPDELARVDQDPDNVAIIFKRPCRYATSDLYHFKVFSVGVFLLSNRLVIVSMENGDMFDGRLFQSVTSLQTLVLRMMYRCVQHFIEHLKVINMISSELEQKISTSMENKNLIHMFSLEKSLVYYLNAIQSNGAVIERLRVNALNPAQFGFNQTEIEFIDDLLIENRQAYEQTRIYSDILAGMMDARASVVNNNLNMLMKQLTIIMIAMMWPPVVCGFLSMNVRMPFDAQSLWAFSAAAVFGLGPLIVLFLQWRHRNRPR